MNKLKPCPACGSDRSSVYDTRKGLRRRVCQACGSRWRTAEVDLLELIDVMKGEKMYKQIMAEALGKILVVNEENGKAVSLQEVLKGLIILKDDEKEAAPKAEEKKRRGRRAIDKSKVMALHNGKWSTAKIADEMGISAATVTQIIKEQEERTSHEG